MQPQPGLAQFFVSGSITGLYPDASGVLTLTVDNPHPFAIDVVELSVVPGAPPEGCTTTGGTHPIETDALVLGSTPLRVPAQAFAIHELHVRMSRTASSGCQGKRFPLRYEGRAIQP